MERVGRGPRTDLVTVGMSQTEVLAMQRQRGAAESIPCRARQFECSLGSYS